VRLSIAADEYSQRNRRLANKADLIADWAKSIVIE
jgi:hypothetical protein